MGLSAQKLLHSTWPWARQASLWAEIAKDHWASGRRPSGGRAAIRPERRAAGHDWVRSVRFGERMSAVA